MAAAPYDATSYPTRIYSSAPINVAGGAAVAKMLAPVQRYALFTKFYNQEGSTNPALPNGGTISGGVTEMGVPLLRCTVRLYFRPTGAFIKSTLTDASGAYSFPGLDPAEVGNFCAVVFDPAGGASYNALIFDKLTPV